MNIDFNIDIEGSSKKIDFDDDELRSEFKLTINEVDLSEWVKKFHVKSYLAENADIAEIQLTDQTAEISQKIKRGDPVVLSWGWNDENPHTEIFRGVVRENDKNTDPLTLECIDYATILNTTIIQHTYENENAEDILKDIIKETGLTPEIEISGISIKRMPFFSATAKQAIDFVTEKVNEKSEEVFFYYLRDGKLFWGPRDREQLPSFGFKTGEDIVAFAKPEKGMSALKSFVSPVLHSQTVLIDEDVYFVMCAEYIWDDGGRIVLGLLGLNEDWNDDRQILSDLLPL